MVTKRNFFIWVIVILFVVLAVLGILIWSSNGSFSTKTVFLKLNIPFEGEAVGKITISNDKNFVQNFELSFKDFEGFAILSEDSFSIPPRGEKEIEIFFKDEKREVGLYSGYLIISNGKEEIDIPIILNVEDERNEISIVQSGIPAYENVYPGGSLGVDIKIYYFGDGNISETIFVKSSIHDFKGNIFWSNDANLTFGTSWTEIVPINSLWEKGKYLFITEVEYKGIKNIAGYLFEVENKKLNFIPSDFKFFFLIISIFLFVFLILFFYFLKTRDELLVELKKQHHAETRRTKSYVKSLKEKILHSKKKSSQKKEMVKKLKKAKSKIFTSLKEKQKSQVSEAKKLKSKNISGVENQMKKWRKEGYKMSEADKEIKKVMDKGLKQQVNKWKNKGHFSN